MAKYLSVNEIAARWGISPSAVYMCRCGTDRLRRFRFGKSVRFLLSEVEMLEAEMLRKAKKVA